MGKLCYSHSAPSLGTASAPRPIWTWWLPYQPTRMTLCFALSLSQAACSLSRLGHSLYSSKGSLPVRVWTRESYSIHSFRRGAATFSFDLGLDPLLIKAQGGWKSDAYLEYISLPLKSRKKLGEALAQAVLDG